MTLAQRSEARRTRMVTNVAGDHERAEEWDLEFWQSMTPQERLSALVGIRRDVEKVQASRNSIQEPGDEG